MNTIDAILNTKELITLPAVATSVLRMLENENAELKEVVRIIQSDPSLSVKILKISNSPLYATRREISSVQQAIMLIGFNKLINIILGVSIFSKFWLSTKPGAEELMNKFWFHSCSTGTVAKFISGKIRKNFNESEFLGGLLHQIGKLAMIQHDIELYKKVIELIENDSIIDFQAEEEVYGVNHLAVGAQLAKLWKLPDDITTVISKYPFPTELQENRDLVASVNLAGIICERNGADFYMGYKNGEIHTTEAWKVLSETSPILVENGPGYLSEGLDEEFKKSADFLSTIRA